MNNTPRSNRLHIAIYGKRNSGKSSLLNALTGQQAALVSGIPGSTTDPVYQSMELHGVGPCVFIDTAGFDDEGELGALRMDKTLKTVDKTDVAILVCTDTELVVELHWLKIFQEKNIPVIIVLNKADLLNQPQEAVERVKCACGKSPFVVSAVSGEGIDCVLQELVRLAADVMQPTIVSHLVAEGDLVLLVMPQDIQAPKGRLILPQVQTLRELLDGHCSVICCTTNQFASTLRLLVKPPRLIVTDSQVFHDVYSQKPAESLLTSFSVLFARQKGDIGYYVESASAIERLTEQSHVLIAEACTHAPLSEDIGRVKIPRLLRKRIGEGLRIDMVSGADFPDDLSAFDFVIHCGGCMFNRRHVLSRIESAKRQHVPMSNYGIVIAWLNGILDKVVY